MMVPHSSLSNAKHFVRISQKCEWEMCTVLFVCLFVCLKSSDSEVHPMLGEKVVCATVSQHL